MYLFSKQQNPDAAINRLLKQLGIHISAAAISAELDKQPDSYQQKQKNYETWAKAYPVALNGVEHHKMDKQKVWFELAEVTATPTMLLNGYRPPELYKLPDSKYMVE